MSEFTARVIERMKLFRKILFWSHLVTGIAAAGVIVIMAGTGVLLTYQKQITAWADRRAMDGQPPATDSRRLSGEQLLGVVGGSIAQKATALTLRRHPASPAEIMVGRERQMVNAYTGKVAGAGSESTREFFRVVTAWHRTLGATGDNRDLGRMITGAANFGFLFLVVSGFYLWWPRNWNWRAFRNVLWFRRRLNGKASDFNWHNVVGFWSLVPLFVIVLSGVVISYRWAGDLVYRAAGEKPPAGAARQTESASSKPERRTFAGIDAALERAAARYPAWKTLTVTLPKVSDSTVSIAIDRGSGGQPQLRSTLIVHRATGREVRVESFEAQSTGRRLRSILRFAHTGEILGVSGQTVAGLVSFGALVLSWTGAALALRRLRSWRARRIVQPCPPLPSDPSLVSGTLSSSATAP